MVLRFLAKRFYVWGGFDVEECLLLNFGPGLKMLLCKMEVLLLSFCCLHEILRARQAKQSLARRLDWMI